MKAYQLGPPPCKVRVGSVSISLGEYVEESAGQRPTDDLIPSCAVMANSHSVI